MCEMVTEQPKDKHLTNPASRCHKTNLTQYITNIIRVNGAVMELRLKTDKLADNLLILNPYAHGRNYEFIVIEDPRGVVSNYIEKSHRAMARW